MENTVNRFGVPHKLIMNNGMCFRSNKFSKFYYKYGIITSYSSQYHPQGNG